MNHLSLFSGIGGFDLAAKWMGWNNIAHVEKNEYCRKILNKHFPKSQSYEDIKEFDGTKYRGSIDIISGGFPCQPFSVAGNQKSKDDDRYLWPEMLRIIREIKPRWIVGENVPGIIKLALDDVLASLEAEGYTCWTFVIPACAVGAWHRRDRVWIVSHRNEIGCNNGEHPIKERPVCIKDVWEDKEDNQARGKREYRAGTFSKATTNASGSRRKNGVYGKEQASEGKAGKLGNGGRECNGGAYWRTEPGVGRVVNGVPLRVDRIKALGNAVVPQVVYEIFKIIEQYEKQP